MTNKKSVSGFLFSAIFLAAVGTQLAGCGGQQTVAIKKAEMLGYHKIKTDADGKIVPWHSANPGKSYDHVIKLVWNFWDTMRMDLNGLPYYMNHQVWEEKVNDRRGIGGDQLQMALSSWALLYAYTGDNRIIENMKFMADYYLSHGLSRPGCAWPNIPYPYNTYIYSGIYDGDMILGKGFTQPDKAGSLGIELITLYKITGNSNYLDAAIKMADTLAMHTKEGDGDNSPLPFKVHAETGETGSLKNAATGAIMARSSYTTNWTGTMRLFIELIKMNKGDISAYKKSFDIFLEWMKKYPLKTNRWGPFFEDVAGWSDTQINAVTFAMYIMENPSLFDDWKSDVRAILDWVYKELGNKKYEKYGVLVVNEQTAYRMQGNSHTARQASIELLYWKLTGDTTWKENAVRQLNWATYMVDSDGKNRYPNDDIWMTDGYGDYVRHYLRAMAACPKLAPDNKDHILSSTSVVTHVEYWPNVRQGLLGRQDKEILNRIRIFYRTYRCPATEVIRMTSKPKKVLVNRKKIKEREDLDAEGWTWEALEKGGILQIRHEAGTEIAIRR